MKSLTGSSMPAILACLSFIAPMLVVVVAQYQTGPVYLKVNSPSDHSLIGATQAALCVSDDIDGQTFWLNHTFENNDQGFLWHPLNVTLPTPPPNVIVTIWSNAISNVQALWTTPTDGGGLLVHFRQDAGVPGTGGPSLMTRTGIDDTAFSGPQEPPSGADNDFPARRWYLCYTYVGSYYWRTLSWLHGGGPPSNPSCVEVEVELEIIEEGAGL
ncbi:hypothetical protein F4778DRAFT_777622 [Xylariomycetidae sp. FL2044]|nr:hypothetical protein F4778DRAFT_777622 [Xylariomycetidae sp. FL2044]